MNAHTTFTEESPQDRIKRLREELAGAEMVRAGELLTGLLSAMDGCAEGGEFESVPPGVRDALRKLGDPENNVRAELNAAQAVLARASQ